MATVLPRNANTTGLPKQMKKQDQVTKPESKPVVNTPKATEKKPEAKPAEVVTKPVEAATKPEEKPTEQVAVSKPQTQEEPKPVETPAPAPVPAAETTVDDTKKNKKKKVKDPLNTNVFIPNQPIISCWRFFFPYFLRLVYFLALIIACISIFVLPIIQLDANLTVAFPGSETAIAFADAVNKVKESNAIFGLIYGIAHTIVPEQGLYSIVDIVFVNLAPVLSGSIPITGIIGVAGSLYCVVLFAIILVIELIWFTIKLVTSIIGFIFFWTRKHKKIDNFYFKNTKGLYSLGLLNWDYTFIVAFILNGLIWAGMNFKILNLILFDAVYNTNMFNQGNLTFLIVFGALFLIRILYRLSVALLSRKVRKMYVRKLNYRALKKAAKKGELLH